MNDQTDSQLLCDYSENRSEAAFSELVRRHIDFVYSAALRMVCDSHLAQDVTQGVFIALSKNAVQLRGRPILSGWLHRTAQNIAAQTVRTDVRRRGREQEAAAMNELLAHEPDATWDNIAPHLDAALGELSEPDRDALLLRYFEKKSAREMAEVLNVSEEAAQKRVNRVVERLREFFSKRNVTIGASGLVVLISANAVQAAPIGLFSAISFAASLAGTAVQASTAIAATKTIAMTTLQKTLITTVIVVATGAGIYQARQNSDLRQRIQALQQQHAEQIQLLEQERDKAKKQLPLGKNEGSFSKSSFAELIKLRGEVGMLKQQLAEANKTKTPMPVSTEQSSLPDDPLEQQKRMAMTKGSDGKNYAMQLYMFASENNGWFPTNWDQLAPYTNEFSVTGTNDFEMVYKKPFNRSEVGTNAGSTILVREFLAWPTFDGKWGKIYGFADGHAQTVILEDGNFAVWEKENTVLLKSEAK